MFIFRFIWRWSHILGFWEVIALLTIALLIFGPKKLPELARGLGEAVREYKKASSGWYEEYEKSKKREEDKEREALLVTAKNLGIETEGKSLEEIAEEILKVTKERSE